VSPCHGQRRGVGSYALAQPKTEPKSFRRTVSTLWVTDLGDLSQGIPAVWKMEKSRTKHYKTRCKVRLRNQLQVEQLMLSR
jgi:hypothetical protein